MPGGFLNQARMSISTTGAGTFTLAAALAGFNTFLTAGAVDQMIIPYSVIDSTANGSEKGWGLYSAAGPTLTRNPFISTNSNNPINASSNAQVFIDPSVADLVHLTLFAHANLGGL
jgi:hypothetical protein